MKDEERKKQKERSWRAKGDGRSVDKKKMDFIATLRW